MNEEDVKNEEYIEFAKEIAAEAGKIMTKYFKEENGATYKLDNTIVTKADIEINKYLIERVKEKYPHHAVDGEEAQFGKSSFVWVCDPIDGTAMYARHIPVAVFSLALVINGRPIIGVVYDPFLDNMYSAIKGQGAYLNNKKIQVNDIMLGDNRSVSNFDMFKDAKYNIYDAIKEISEKTYFVCIGSAVHAFMMVARGDFNLAIFPGTDHKNCDVAAAKIIVEEAGGKVTDLFGNEQRYDKSINGAVVTNGIIHNEVIEVIKKSIK